MHDYYLEQSCGTFHVEGKVLDWVEVSKNRADYSQGAGRNAARTVLLTEALDVLYDRDGKDALQDYDGIFFLYAGDRVQTTRGGLYWPHKANFSHKGKRWSYFICPDCGERDEIFGQGKLAGLVWRLDCGLAAHARIVLVI